MRANSILRKLGGDLPELTEPQHELAPAEVELIELISRFPKEVQRAAAELRPLCLASLGYDLARSFSDFYNQCPVISAEPAVRAFRVHLVAAAKQAMANCLNILGIRAPEVM